MPSIIGSKSCCAVNNRPAPTCAGTLALLCSSFGGSFSLLGSGVLPDPCSGRPGAAATYSNSNFNKRSGTAGYGADLAYIHHAGFADFAVNAAPWLRAELTRGGIRKGLVVDLGCGSGVWA